MTRERGLVGSELATVWGPKVPAHRAPRVLGLFAHPDDEVFCVGGTIARCAAAGAVTGIVSLTHGEAGQIRDACVATRRTLGPVRAKELERAATELGVDDVTCLDLGDGHLSERPLDELAAVIRDVIEPFQPDVVVTFGPDGAFGHPDHVTSCHATLAAIRGMAEQPRVLHALFPMREQLLVDLLVDWLTSSSERFCGTAAFAHALKLFADGSSMLGFAADHLDVEWFPAGSFVIEQGERASELFCILSGTVDVVVEGADGSMQWRDAAGAGCFVGEDGLASGRPRNAHVIARDNVTCLVLAPNGPHRFAGRGAGAAVAPAVASTSATGRLGADLEECFTIDGTPALEKKVAALAAHRSQYAMEPDLFPRSILRRLLGVEHFAVAGIREA